MRDEIEGTEGEMNVNSEGGRRKHVTPEIRALRSPCRALVVQLRLQRPVAALLVPERRLVAAQLVAQQDLRTV